MNAPRRSLNKTPCFERGSQQSSVVQSVALVPSVGQIVPPVHAFAGGQDSLHARGSRASNSSANNTQESLGRRMRSHDLNSRSSVYGSAHAARPVAESRYKLKRDKDVLDESFNKIEYLLSQTNKMQ